MRTIYKYKLDTGNTLIPVTEGAIILRANMQGDDPVVWVELDPYAPSMFKEIVVVGTGWQVPDSACFIDTFFTQNYVWHAYEVN